MDQMAVAKEYASMSMLEWILFFHCLYLLSEKLFTGLSSQMEFMLETITDIKNNKKRAKEDTPQHTRMKKWLQKVLQIDVLNEYIYVILLLHCYWFTSPT